MTELLEQGSAPDLVLRGYPRDEVRELTGVDVGYNANSMKAQLKGIDRWQYKLSHVRECVPSARIDELLERYGRGEFSVEEMLVELGLRNPTLVKLKKLFADLDGGSWSEVFAEAESSRRTTTMRRGMVAKHGVENPFELDEVQAQAAATRKERYGAEYTLAAGSSLAEGARETLAQRMTDPEVRAEIVSKRKRSTRASLGVDSPAQSSVVQGKMRDTNLARYGVEYFAQQDAVREGMSETMRVDGFRRSLLSRRTFEQNYGVSNPAQRVDQRQSQSLRMRDPEHQKRITAAKARNGTFSSSAPETQLAARLLAVFGEQDLVVQHRDDERYPFACDFYVPSRDLFIELNGSWTHGGHWFDPKSGMDADKVSMWQSKGGRYQANAVQTWTERDVIKRVKAAEHGLNYVVLWDGSESLLDAKLWIAMGCPDGRDWEHEYSWLPSRKPDLDGDWPELSRRSRAATAIARRANWSEFYARELAMWEANETSSRKWGTTQARLYANRLEHMDAERGAGKLPDQLSDLEILRGLGISGALRAYTVFDNTAMTEVLERYGPSAVYDPCAGWGERLVTCAASGVTYEGTDINPAVVAGHERIVAQYGLTAQHSTVGDAASRDMRGGQHEMVFTCPPYGGIEVYTQAGAENLDEEAFLAWWAQAVAMSVSASTTVFAYQINQAWRDRMNRVVVDAGWELVDQVAVLGRSSHFTRGKGGVDRKNERESVQVFERRG